MHGQSHIVLVIEAVHHSLCLHQICRIQLTSLLLQPRQLWRPQLHLCFAITSPLFLNPVCLSVNDRKMFDRLTHLQPGGRAIYILKQGCPTALHKGVACASTPAEGRSCHILKLAGNCPFTFSTLQFRANTLCKRLHRISLYTAFRGGKCSSKSNVKFALTLDLLLLIFAWYLIHTYIHTFIWISHEVHRKTIFADLKIL